MDKNGQKEQNLGREKSFYICSHVRGFVRANFGFCSSW